MIQRIDDLPAGVIGLRASGKLTRDDYALVLEPAIQEGVASGELRLLFELDDFDGLGEGAWVEDAKTGARAYLKERHVWRRFAIVTDVEWVAKATKGFTWLIPGEAKVYALASRAEAREWVAG